jgi:hypothetical protein
MRRVPWIALSILVFTGLGWAALRLHLGGQLWIPACPLKQATGIPCLSCGLTRCLEAMVQGDLRQAFHWHPVGLMGVFLLPVLGAWDIIRMVRGQDYPELPERAWARALVFGVLAGTWWLQVARGI